MLHEMRRRWRNSSFYYNWLAYETRRIARPNQVLFAGVKQVCLFIGHGRSGHSLVAGLLDAHPQIVMADELDSLRLLRRPFNQAQFFAYYLRGAQNHARHGRSKGQRRDRAYSYRVPNQWQGRSEQLRVIGEAGLCTARLAQSPHLLPKFQRRVQVPVCFIQVVRNPFDCIARLHLLTGYPPELLAQHFFVNCEHVVHFRERTPPEMTGLVQHEALVADPPAALRLLCQFLGLQAPDDYLADCASIVFPRPEQPRYQITWQDDQIAMVLDGIARYEFLHGYTFDD